MTGRQFYQYVRMRLFHVVSIGEGMTKARWVRSVLLVACGMVLGIGLEVGWRHAAMPAVSAQQPATPPAPTLPTVAADVARLTSLLPSNSHIMMDVQFHWTNLWFAGQKKNWPLAKFYFDESRSHIQWMIRKSPTVRSQIDGKDVDIKSIFEAVDTSSLADVMKAIEKKDVVQFSAAYKTMLESCYACHKSAGRAYLRPMIPREPTQTVSISTGSNLAREM